MFHAYREYTLEPDGQFLKLSDVQNCRLFGKYERKHTGSEQTAFIHEVGVPGVNLKLPKRKADVRTDARHGKGLRHPNERDRLEDNDIDGRAVLMLKWMSQ